MKKTILMFLTFFLLCSGYYNLNAQFNKTKWMDGNWWGVGCQPYALDHQDWEIFLTYNYENKTIKISYPEFPCSGHWKLVKANKNKAEFIEYITEGENLCNNEGKVIITRIDDNYITVSYFLPKVVEGVIAFGTLQKLKEK
jgi:hypothetical protein